MLAGQLLGRRLPLGFKILSKSQRQRLAHHVYMLGCIQHTHNNSMAPLCTSICPIAGPCLLLEKLILWLSVQAT